MSKKIYLSPSSQLNNIYATGNTNEMVQCNKIALCVQTALLRHGFLVKKSAQGQSMQKSIEESNAWNPDLHIPIHTNALNGKCDGPLVMVYKKHGNNLAAAESIYKSLLGSTPGTTQRDIAERPDLAELKNTSAVSVYIECEFHDNPEISDWIIKNTSIIGEAIARGICNYFGIQYYLEKAEEKTLYKVQVGCFKEKSNAKAQLENIISLGFTDAFIVQVKDNG